MISSWTHWHRSTNGYFVGNHPQDGKYQFAKDDGGPYLFSKELGKYFTWHKLSKNKFYPGAESDIIKGKFWGVAKYITMLVY